jgi:serine/threonine kinase 32
VKRSSGYVSIYAELKILTLLDHPFICNAHYAFQDSCYLFLVLDLAKAGDMRYNLSLLGGIFSEELARFYLCQVILALEYLHQLRIIHSTTPSPLALPHDVLLSIYLSGDIKPENILLNDDGFIKLTDFGVSKFLSPFDDCRSTSGTHGYMVALPPSLVEFCLTLW